MKKKFLAAALIFALAAALCPKIAPTALATTSDFVMEGGTLVAYNGSGGHVIIPEGVSCIGEYCFYDRDDITVVTFPSTLKSIDDAFESCDSLTEVVIPEGVTYIYGFRDCSNLTRVTLPSTVKNFSNMGFRGTPWWDNQDGLIIINGVLMGYHGVGGDIVIPNEVAELEIAVFNGCDGLTSVFVEGPVESIPMNTFYGCSNLTAVILSDTVKHIDSQAFVYCPNLTDVWIPPAVEEGLRYEGDLGLGYPGTFGHSPNLTIHGVSGSYAESYAQKAGINFVANYDSKPSPTPTVLYSGNLGDDGAALSFSYSDDGNISFTGNLPADNTIFVACYDDAGRFVGVKAIDADSMSADLGTDHAKLKLFWLGGALAPQCEAREVTLTD